MANTSLEAWSEAIRSAWGPLDSELVARCRRQVERLAKAPATEDWLAALHRAAPASEELYRDPVHDFMLLAHTEQAGLYRPPHDHGRAWVIYAVQLGEVEMGTYARIDGPDGQPRLVKRNATLVRPGETQVYLPGDIHDTLCVTGPALLFRFTERDLRKEDRQARRLTRYVERNGVWTVGVA